MVGITEGLLQLSNVSTAKGHSLKLVSCYTTGRQVGCIFDTRQSTRVSSHGLKYVATVLQSYWSNLGMLYTLPEDVVMAPSVKYLNQDDNFGTINL